MAKAAKAGANNKAVAGRAVGSVLTAERTNEILTHAPRIQALEYATGLQPSATPYTRDTIRGYNVNSIPNSRARFDPVIIGDARITATDNEDHFLERLYHEVEFATVPLLCKPFGICEEPIEEANVGRVRVNGYTQARCNITDANHKCALPDESDSTRLKSAFGGGAPFIWKESGTGLKWCVIDLSRRCRSYFEAYGYSTQTWDSMMYGLDHPLYFPYTRTDASGGTITKVDTTSIFSSSYVSWSYFDLACAGKHKVEYTVSAIEGDDPNATNFNRIKAYVERSTNDGVSWSEVFYTETSDAVLYTEPVAPATTGTPAPCKVHLTSIGFDVDASAGDWLRIQVSTYNDASTQGWVANRAYVRIERVDL